MPERMIDWFWRFACMAVMNVPLEQCSTAALLRVHAQQAERLLGDRIVRNAEAVRIEPGAVMLRDGRRMAARYVVCAVPPQDLGALAPQLAERFEPSPYISVYLWFDRKLTRERFWALLWSPERLNYDFYDLWNIRSGWQAPPA